MAFRTALFWSAIQSLLRLVLSFISIKITAVYLGAPGLALIGQLGNFINLVQGGAGNAIQTGIVKLTAESDGDVDRQQRVWSTGFQMALFLAVFVCFVVMGSSWLISGWLFDSDEYWSVIVLIGPCIMLGILGVIFTGILNGLKRIRELALITILTTIIGAVLFIPLAYRFGVWGGLIGTGLSYSSLFFVGWIMLSRAKVLDKKKLVGYWDSSVVRELIRFYPMLLAHTAIAPLALILIRNILIAGLDMQVAGYWQAVWRVSDMYTLVLTTALSFYLMPHLSSISEETVFARELFGIMYKVALLTATAALGVYLFRDAMIAIVFTKEFVPIKDLLAWQLIGDVLKMASWPLRMALVIKLRSHWYIALEVFTPLIHAGFAYVMLPQLHGNAATSGYAFAYFVTNILLLIALRDYTVRCIKNIPS